MAIGNFIEFDMSKYLLSFIGRDVQSVNDYSYRKITLSDLEDPETYPKGTYFFQIWGIYDSSINFESAGSAYKKGRFIYRNSAPSKFTTSSAFGYQKALPVISSLYKTYSTDSSLKNYDIAFTSFGGYIIINGEYQLYSYKKTSSTVVLDLSAEWNKRGDAYGSAMLVMGMNQEKNKIMFWWASGIEPSNKPSLPQIGEELLSLGFYDAQVFYCYAVEDDNNSITIENPPHMLIGKKKTNTSLQFLNGSTYPSITERYFKNYYKDRYQDSYLRDKYWGCTYLALIPREPEPEENIVPKRILFRNPFKK